MAESDDNFQKFVEDANFNKFLEDADRNMWKRLLFMYMNDRMNEKEFMSDILPCSVGLLAVNSSNCEHVKKILMDPLETKWRMSFSTNYLERSLEEDEEYCADFNIKDGIYSFKLWWIILLRFYIQQTKDYTVLDIKVQTEVHAIVECLLHKSDRHPQLWKFECSKRFMSGDCPIEGQAILYFSLKSADELMNLPQFEHGQRLMDWSLNSTREQINCQITRMDFLIPKYYWVDKYKVANHETALFQGGFYGTTRSLMGNCIAILSSLATPQEAEAIMNFIEKSLPQPNEYYVDKAYFEDFHGLLWLLVAASVKARKIEIAQRAIELFEKQCPPSGIDLQDGKSKANWTYCGYLVSKILIRNESVISKFSFEKASASNTEYLSTFLEQREKIITRFKLIKKHFKELWREIEQAYAKEWLIYCRSTHLQQICEQLATNFQIDSRTAREFLLDFHGCRDRNWTIGLLDFPGYMDRKQELNWTLRPEFISDVIQEISMNSKGPLRELLRQKFNEHRTSMRKYLMMVHDLAIKTNPVNLREHLLELEDLHISIPRCERFWMVVEERERTGKCLDCNNKPANFELPCGHKYSCKECISKLFDELTSGEYSWLRLPYFCVLCDEPIDFSNH